LRFDGDSIEIQLRFDGDLLRYEGLLTFVEMT